MSMNEIFLDHRSGVLRRGRGSMRSADREVGVSVKEAGVAESQVLQSAGRGKWCAPDLSFPIFSHPCLGSLSVYK